MKQNQSGAAHLVLIVVLVIVVVAGTGWFVLNGQQTRSNSKDSTKQTGTAQTNSKNPKSAEPTVLQQVTNPETKQPVKIVADKYYQVVLSNSQRYYGNAKRINDQYLRLSKVYYFEKGNLVGLGNELHGPESAMYIATSKLQSFAELPSSDQTYTAIKGHSLKPTEPKDAYPASNIDAYLKKSQLQAFYYDDGKVYFTRASSLADGFLGKSKTYTLRVNPNPALSDPNATDISLVKVEPPTLTGYTTSKLLFWENLRDDSQVTNAIETYEQHNP